MDALCAYGPYHAERNNHCFEVVAILYGCLYIRGELTANTGVAMMETRFKKKSQIIDVGITAVGAVLSVGTMLYGIGHFGLGEAWNELVLDLLYIALW